MMTGALAILLGILGCLLLAGVMTVLGRVGLSRWRQRRDSDTVPPGQAPHP
jgi:hypothetical protein